MMFQPGDKVRFKGAPCGLKEKAHLIGFEGEVIAAHRNNSTGKHAYNVRYTDPISREINEYYWYGKDLVLVDSIILLTPDEMDNLEDIHAAQELMREIEK